MFGPETFLMRMAGGSMAPRFLDGDYLYVDPDEPAVPGCFGAVRDGGEGHTARPFAEADGRRVLRRALAPGWPEVAPHAGNETMILGVVVFAGRGV